MARFYWFVLILAYYYVINLIGVYIFWVYLCGAGCPVGSNNFVGDTLCVEIPVTVLRVFLGNVTSFWNTFVLGGGVM